MCSRTDDPSQHEPEERPNIAHYWRPTSRHLWRESSVTVNADPSSVPTYRREGQAEYADIPYDVECWTPPRRTRVLPGLPPWRVAQCREAMA